MYAYTVLFLSFELQVENITSHQSDLKKKLDIIKPRESKTFSVFNIVIIAELSHKCSRRFIILGGSLRCVDLDLFDVFIQHLACTSKGSLSIAKLFIMDSNTNPHVMSFYLYIFFVGSSDNLLSLGFEINPVDSTAYYSLKLSLEPVNVNFHKVC